MSPDRVLDGYAARQYGTFSLAQATASGFSGRMAHRRLETGAWIRLTSGVYALGSAPPKWERQLAAAVLSVPQAIVAGSSAAFLHGFEGARRGRPVIMVPRGSNGRSDLAKVIRSRFFTDVEQARVSGFMATGPVDTVLTLAPTLPPGRLEALVDDVLASRRAEIADFEAMLERISGARARGSRRLRWIVEERRSTAYQPPANDLERCLHRLVDHPLVPPTSAQRPFDLDGLHMVVDTFIAEWGLIVEADGRRWHTRRADFERDRRRDNAAAAAGLGVLRFTYQMLTNEPRYCLDTLLATGRARCHE